MKMMNARFTLSSSQLVVSYMKMLRCRYLGLIDVKPNLDLNSVRSGYKGAA